MKNRFDNPTVRLIGVGNLSAKKRTHRLQSKNTGWPKKVELYQVLSPASFQMMFREVHGDVGKLCLTDDQGIQACHAHPDWLDLCREAPLFMIDRNNQDRPATEDNLFVLIFTADSKGNLQIRSHSFKYKHVWAAKKRPHLLVRQAVPGRKVI